MTHGRRGADLGVTTGAGVDLERVAWLARLLRVRLGDRVRADLATRALLTSDASNYRVLPALVVTPASVEQLAEVAGLCGEAGVPLTMRGAGTSIAGNAVGAGVLVLTRDLASIGEVDPEAATAVVEPGVVLDDLNRRAAVHGLRVGPDPSTHSRCTVGGMIGNDACGSHSVRWGTTAQNVLALDVVRSDGRREQVDDRWLASDSELAVGVRDLVEAHAEVIREELPPWPRRVSGFALDWLLPERGGDVRRALVGTEGTCVLIAGATVRLVRPPASRSLLVLGFPDDIAGAEAVPALLAPEPLTVESLTPELLGHAWARSARELLPSGGAWLLVEAGGEDPGAARDHASRLAARIGRDLAHPDVRLLDDSRAQAMLWRIREDGSGGASRLPDGSAAWPGFEDSAVPPARLAGYLAELRRLLRDHGLSGTTYGHFGEGCIHLRVGFGLDRPEGVRRFERFMGEAADLVVAHGGTLSGEHGDGRARGALLPRMFSPRLLGAFADFKRLWDPRGVLNPGIVVEPRPITEALRAAVRTRPGVVPTLALHADGGDLRAAAARCIGVGRCVSTQGSALMCPSFRATGREQDSTRGRARLLQEMLAGSLSAEGWRSTAVRDALDLCLACKGCLSECPTGVDMASYKVEFLSHHYRHRLRPRSHYSLGWLPLWLRLARRMPRLVDLVTRSRATRSAFAFVAGIAPERSIPPLARRTFVRGHVPRPADGPAPAGRVILWPDTFNDHLTPGVAHAAVRVLEAAGFGVDVPRSWVCCGLTWVTTGQLGTARRVLRHSLAAPELATDDPVVVLEPSCATMLRSDLTDLLPADPRAAALAKRVVTLGEALDRVGFRAPVAAGEDAADNATLVRDGALMQPHCHQQAVLGTDADRRVLERNGIAVGEMLDGCCGLAGNFGAERGHDAVSRAVAGLALWPALERSGPARLVLADGFSCRTQIEALSGRQARHLAEVLAERLPG